MTFEKEKLKNQLKKGLDIIEGGNEEEIREFLIHLTDELDIGYSSILGPGWHFPESTRQHIEKYWRLSREFYDESDYPLAAFFAITLIEELSKFLIVGRQDNTGRLGLKSFYNHSLKYENAIITTLYVNSRVSRIYGKYYDLFYKWYSEGRLFQIRNQALYLEIVNDKLNPPVDLISKEMAFLLVCFSGEIYQQIQGPYTSAKTNDFNRIIDEIDAFRERYNDWPTILLEGLDR